MTVRRSISFRHGLDQLYVNFCRLRDGVPLDPSAFEGPLQPVQMVAGLGQAWGRAKLVRAVVVIGLMPLLAWLASALGVPLWASVCSLMVLGPIAWFGLSTLLVFRTMRGQAEKVTKQLEESRSVSAALQDATLEVEEERLIFRVGTTTLTHPWKELTAVTAGEEGLTIALSLELPEGEGRFRHSWLIPAKAFSSGDELRELADFIEQKRASSPERTGFA